MPHLRRRELIAASVAALAAPDLSAADVLGSASGDIQVLLRLVAMEAGIVFGYERVLSARVLSKASEPVVAGVLPHERDHVRILATELERRGSTPPPAAGERALSALGVSGTPHSSPDAVHYLIRLETIAEGAYYGSMARLTDPSLVRLAAEILGSEAQHWSALSGLLQSGDVYAAVPSATVTGA